MRSPSTPGGAAAGVGSASRDPSRCGTAATPPLPAADGTHAPAAAADDEEEGRAEEEAWLGAAGADAPDSARDDEAEEDEAAEAEAAEAGTVGEPWARDDAADDAVADAEAAAAAEPAGAAAALPAADPAPEPATSGPAFVASCRGGPATARAMADCIRLVTTTAEARPARNAGFLAAPPLPASAPPAAAAAPGAGAAEPAAEEMAKAAPRAPPVTGDEAEP